MRLLAGRSHFKEWSTSWYIASCHQISSHNVISSHFLIWVIIPQTWSKPSKFCETCKNWPSVAILYSDLLLLLCIPPNCRPIAKILKELEWQRRSGRTDGQTDGQADTWNDAIPVGAMAADGKICYVRPQLYLKCVVYLIFLHIINKGESIAQPLVMI